MLVARSRPQSQAVNVAGVEAAAAAVADAVLERINGAEAPEPLAALGIDIPGDDGGDQGLLGGVTLAVLPLAESDARRDFGPEAYWFFYNWRTVPFIELDFDDSTNRRAEAAVRAIADNMGIDGLSAKQLFFDEVGRLVVDRRSQILTGTSEDFAVLAGRHEEFEAGILDSVSWTAGDAVTRRLTGRGLVPDAESVNRDGDEWERL